MKDLRNQVVLITGGGSGLGRLFCLEFAKEGAVVVTVDLAEPALEETKQIVNQQTGQLITTMICDLSNKANIYATTEKIKTQFGRVDVLVNNAGVVSGKSFLQVTDEQIQRTMDVNIMAHMWLARALLPGMIAANHGHIVTIASAAGLVGVSGLADYCASKWAAVGFDESLRFELQDLGVTGVKTTCVCPYYINTGMFDGVKPMFLVPILQPNYVISQVMKAVKGNKAAVWLPLILYVLPLMRSLLPVWLFDKIAFWLGMHKGMHTFKGRTSAPQLDKKTN